MKIFALQIVILFVTLLTGCSYLPSRSAPNDAMPLSNPPPLAEITAAQYLERSQAVNATHNSAQNKVHVYPYTTAPTIIASSAPIPNRHYPKPSAAHAHNQVRPIIHAIGANTTTTRPQTSYTDRDTINTAGNTHSTIPETPPYITDIDTDIYPQIPYDDDTIIADPQTYTDYDANIDYTDSYQPQDAVSKPQEPAQELIPAEPPPIAKRPLRPPLTVALITKPTPFISPGLTSIAPVKALLEQASKQRAAGNLVMAAGTLERSLRIEPRNPHLWNRLARIRLEQGLFSQANSLAAKSNTLAGNDENLLRENKRIIGEARKRVDVR